ncbi:TolC family protein [Hufsiella ginkgonis]|uniref:TolC family protein n=1 Tax=Hufsiella ginkgonis TaxID=2695274 RepID=A0A7K1XZI3_9SPHI|nr:TolC family protein [Hufsiella ginkgonis]MXV16425.1 TolC family protein [Hufsiella ginkgonis]
MNQIRYLLFLLPLAFCGAAAQTKTDTLAGPVTLEQCIRYALKNQPGVQQSLLDEEITERDIRASLAGWLPQVSGDANLSHYLKRPTTLFNGQPVQIQPSYSSLFGVEANQSIFSTGLVLASKASRFTREQSRQNTELTRIATVTDVSKAYYNILTSQEQLRILDEDILRLEKQLKDSYAQYQAGIADKTDYQRATITLNGARAQKKTTAESLNYKYAYLKQLIGLSPQTPIQLAVRSTGMEQEMLLDTLQALNYDNRVEIRQLRTRQQLLALNTSYYRYGFLPEVSAFVNYNLSYQNNRFQDLYSTKYPNSQAGLTLSIPIFTGTRRLQNLRRAELQERRMELDLVDTRNAVNTEYQTAIASYRSNLNEWKTYQANVALARDVYNTIKLQYNEGIKTFLEVTIAESDLRTAEISYLNALYSVLSSKLDVQKASGTLPVNP